ncbi:PKD domain-containing protein [Flavivirga jejuensis]|uniref:PKD domain-containing protein n=1 Tax=Flavivirga jejuensis TaxID=870487 RepID=A0ABT8WKC5_9FLAO|nr:PKD domain-containing protein [Flavivirga jejuensis]MDO5973421.1 PKD domain-containing protein [Flavivirga jejuensis]
MATKKNKDFSKKGLIKAAFLLLLVLAFSCSEDDENEETIIITPSAIAAFTETVDVNDYKTYSFTDRSTNTTSYEWDFGDGNVSSEAEPTNTFPQAGSYKVSLTVSQGSSNSDTVEKTIVVTNPDAPVVGFSFTVDSNDWQTYTFTNSTTNAVSYIWDFGDNTSSTDFEPTKTYSEAGDFMVTLTATNDSDDSTTLVQTISVVDPDPIVIPTFAAVLQNADMQTYPTSENNNNDLVDAWTIDPDNMFNDGTDTPFNFWRNDDLENWVSMPANNGGSGTTDKGSSSGANAMSAGGTSARSLKFDSSGERAYQPFEVETGVEYTISAFVRTESTPVGNIEGTFYILSDQPTSDNDLASLTLTSQQVVSDAVDGWQQVSFGFSADATFSFPESRVSENTNDILVSTDQKFVIFYFVPTNTVTGDNEVFLTDIVIETPGL